MLRKMTSGMEILIKYAQKDGVQGAVKDNKLGDTVG